MKTLLFIFLLLFTTTVEAATLPDKTLSIAKKDVGIVELTNSNDGPRIEQIQKTAGIPKGLAYCAASVYTWYKEGSNSLEIKCPLPRTASVMTLYKIAKANPSKYKIIPVKQIITGQEKLKPGDIIIWQYTELTGHTGLVEYQISAKMLQSIEGNTSLSNAVNAQREQNKYSKNRGGIFRKNRPINNGVNMKLLGVIRVRK